MAMN